MSEKAMKKAVSSSTKTRFSVLTVIMLIVLTFYAFTLLGLIFWGIMTSFKEVIGPDSYQFDKYHLPSEIIWDNYQYAFKYLTVDILRPDGNGGVKQGVAGMSEMYYNSVMYSVGAAFFATLVPCLTAYLCARFKFKFSNILYTIVIIVMIVPIVGSLPSEIQMMRTFGIYDKIWSMWVMKANFLGMYFLVFYNVFKALPMAYTEAAKIDGAGNFTILSKIILPLVRNTFFTVMLILFIQIWNDYQVPLKYMPNYPTIAYGFQNAVGKAGNSGMDEIPRQMAAAVLVISPVLVLFLAFQKKLLGNLTVGGIKG